MGAVKSYMLNLSDKLGKDFSELTNEDFQKSVRDREVKKLCDEVKNKKNYIKKF
jgi:hypothetical protein